MTWARIFAPGTALLASAWLTVAPTNALAAAAPSLASALHYPFESELVAAERATAIAWVRDLSGERNVWIAQGPLLKPRQVSTWRGDDGQEITSLAFSPDGKRLVFVRGGDHDANWPAAGDLPPDPTSSPTAPEMAVWSAASAGGAPIRVDGGDAPAISARGVLAYLKDHQVWTAPLDGKGKPERLFFDRGRDGELAWSPDGLALAFTSDRGDHAFIGVWRGKDRPITWLAPSTGQDSSPRWSTDGRRIAFVRNQGDGGPPDPWLVEVPHPFALMTADAVSGEGATVWRSPATAEGSFPEVAGGANLVWAAGDRLVFLAELDGWEHLYSIPAGGGAPALLTPGAFMVEDIAPSADRTSIVYSANAGATAHDGERRHLFKVSPAGGPPVPLTAGVGLEWRPTPLASGALAFVAAGANRPPGIAVVDAGTRRDLDDGGVPADFPAGDFVGPTPVSFRAADGLLVHGVLFEKPGAARQPGVVFLHGGPPRQMMLGWHYMDYYSNAYAVNQYLASHGFTVLALNYRLGIGYGRAYQHPEHAGPAGSSEYQDVQAAGRYLQALPTVDPARIGVWGGSYGGLLTALALARNSDLFKAGVDLHGVHDWSRAIARDAPAPFRRFEQGDRARAMAVAFAASPDADIASWRSPVLLIQGDDDRNVEFHDTVDLARRLEARGVPFEELVLPDEIHGFLRHASWLKADEATVGFLRRELRVTGEQ